MSPRNVAARPIPERLDDLGAQLLLRVYSAAGSVEGAKTLWATAAVMSGIDPDAIDPRPMWAEQMRAIDPSWPEGQPAPAPAPAPARASAGPAASPRGNSAPVKKAPPDAQKETAAGRLTCGGDVASAEDPTMREDPNERRPAPQPTPPPTPAEPGPRFASWAARGFEAALVPIVPGDVPADRWQGSPANLGKCPARLDGETWRPLPGWQRVSPTPALLQSWDESGANVGLRTRNFPTLDCDVDDPEIARLAEGVIVSSLELFGGRASVRRRAGSSRFAIPGRLEGPPLRKVTLSFKLLDGRPQKIELLGDGQQFVVEGTHRSGARLTWSPAPPVAEELPRLGAQLAEMVFQDLERALAEVGCTDIERSGGGGQAGAGEEKLAAGDGSWVPTGAALEREIEKARGALAVLDPADFAEPEWAMVGAALRHDLGKAGLALWDDWSARDEGVAKDGGPRYPGKAGLLRHWRTFKCKGVDPATGKHPRCAQLGSLYRLADETGAAWRPAPSPDEDFTDPPGDGGDGCSDILGDGRVRVMVAPATYGRMLPEIAAALIRDGLLRVDKAYVQVDEDAVPGTTHPENDKRPEREQLPAPKQVQLVPMGHAAMAVAIERSVVLYKKTADGGQRVIDASPQLLKYMIDLPDKRTPQVVGLVQHPIITPGGRLIDREGYDRGTGLYVALGGWRFPEVPARPTRDDAVAAARRVRELLLAETMLRDKAMDGAAAIAAYLIGLSRKVLPQAPAVLVNATVQGTGKTTLARQLHVALTGRDMAVQTMPPDETELQKQTLSTLIRQPAMVCFDNLPDGTTFDSPQIAKLVTSPHFVGRLLGASQDVTVPTNVLWVFTGNAITAGPDLLRRLVKVDLLAREAQPEQHRYAHPDPVRRAQEVRAEVVAALLTMQRAWLVAGEPEDGPSFGFEPAFDRLVTWPLAFAGEEGLFEKRAEVAEQSPAEAAKVALLVALRERYGEAEFTAGAVVREVGGGNGSSEFLDPPARALHDAIEAGDRRRLSSVSALGKFLAVLIDQPPRGGLILRCRTLRGVAQYQVVREPPA